MIRSPRLAALAALAIAAVVSPPSHGQAVKELVGHKEAVATVTYSPDGKQIATGSFDKTVKLWDAATLKEVRTLEGHNGMVLTVLFTKDGRLLSGGEDNLVKLWQFASGPPPKPFPSAPAVLKTLALSKDGKVLAGGGEDGVVRLYDVAAMKPLRDITGHAGPVFAAAFSPDGARLYSTAADRTLRVWEVASGKALAAYEVGVQPATSLALAPKEDAVYLGKPTGQVERLPLPLPGVATLAGHQAAILFVRKHPTAPRILSASADKTVKVFDVAAGKEVISIGSPANPLDVAVSPADANLLAIAGDDKAVRLFNLADGKAVAAKEGLPNPATSVAFTTDGKALIVGEADGSVRLHPYPFVPELAVRPALVHDGAITSLAKSADGTLLLTGGEDKVARLWNADGSPVRGYALFSPVKSVAIAPGKQLVAAVGAAGEWRVWNINGQELKVATGGAGPVAFSPDGALLAVATIDHKVFLFPTAFNAEPKLIATHASPVRSIAFAPSGAIVLSAGNDKVLKISDVAQAKEVASLAGHQAPITAIAVAPDSKTAVTASEDKNGIVWDLAMGKAAATLGGSGAPLTGAAISGDGAKIALASADNNVRIYQGGAVVATVASPAPTGVAFLADNASVVTSSSDKNLRFITQDPPRVMAKHASKVNRALPTPDGKLLVSIGDDGQVKVSDLSNGAAVRAMVHQGPALALALSPDGSKVVTGGADKTCKVWNLADGKELASYAATNAVTDVAVSRDGQKIAFASSDNIARAHILGGAELASFTIGGLKGIDFADDATVVAGSADKALRAGKLTKSWIQAHGGAVTALAINGDGTKIISAGADNAVVVRNAADGAAVKPIAIPAPTSLSLAADNVRLVVGSGDKILRLADAAAGTVIQAYPAGDQPIVSVAIAPAGTSLASIDAVGAVSLWSTPVDKSLGALLSKIPTAAPGTAVVALPDNKNFAASSGDKTIRVIELPPPPVINLAGHTSQVYGLALSPDGKIAASAGADNKVILWDLAAQKAIKTLEGHKAQAYGVAFNPDGKLLASTSGDKTVILWDIATGKPVHTLGGALDSLYQVFFTPDGKFVAAGGVDKTPRMWDVATGKEVKAFAGQPDEIYGLKISPKGTRFATSGYTGAVLIWDLAAGKPLHQQKLSFGAFDVAYRPDGAQVIVANNDKKAYVIDLPEPAR